MAALLTVSASVLAAAPARAALISGFRDAPSADRVVLVEAAVEALSDRYLAAAGAGHADARWRRATRDFVADLWRAVDAARTGVAISLVDDGAEGLRVVVGSVGARQFTLSPPRPAEIAALESDVLRRWCLRIACDGGTAPTVVADTGMAGSAAASTATRPPASAFALVPEDGADGLVCRPGGRHGRLQATACATLLGEIRAVVAALQAQARARIEVDRDALANAVWRDGRRRLVVDLHGHSIAVEAPLLGRFPQLFETLLPWIAGRLTGKVAPLTIEPPARLVYASAAAAF